MKKLFLFLLLSFISLSSFAQVFVLNPDGLADSKNVENDFLVIPIEGKSAAELYSATKSYIHQKIKNPKFAIKADVEDEYIRYDMLVPQITVIKKMGVKLIAQAHFSVEIRFKDNRIRYNIIDLRFPFEDSDKEIVLVGHNWGSWHFFDKNGKVKLKDQKVQVETFFNNEVNDLIYFISDNGNPTIEEW
jgi:hypothetical protein